MNFMNFKEVSFRETFVSPSSLLYSHCLTSLKEYTNSQYVNIFDFCMYCAVRVVVSDVR
jgi:hypothetical protein